MAVDDVGRLGPVLDVRDRFGDERHRLVETLAGLRVAQWAAATACPGWTAKDVAAHILGDDLARLARTRDGFASPGPCAGEGLVAFIDRINLEWVRAARRMSNRLVVSALRWTGPQIAAMWSSLPLDQPSEPVSWAGPDIAPVWLDAARDLTEYWVHHQQIREAVGLPVRTETPTAAMVVDTFMRALPFTLRAVPRPSGTRLTLVVEGSSGGSWTVERDRDTWRLVPSGPAADTTVMVDVDTAWRLCSRMIEPDTAIGRAAITGDRELGRAALRIVSIIRAE